jgi:hypothetical protein
MQHSQAPGPDERGLSDQERAQRQIMWAVRDMGDRFVELLDQLGNSRELSLARTRLEEAVMWATKGITGSINPPVAEPSIRRILLDIYDKIAAAVAAMKSGDTSALQAHVAQIDQHLSTLDQNDTDEQTRLSTIEAGIAKIADAAAPADTTGSGTDTGGSTGGTDTGTGDQPADPTA